MFIGLFCSAADAQSNSLFRDSGSRTSSPPPATQPASRVREALLAVSPVYGYHQDMRDDDPPPPNQTLLAASMIAVEAPTPRRIRVHDRVTIVIREEKRSTSDSDLKREKKWEIEAELKEWLRINEECKLIPQVKQSCPVNPSVSISWWILIPTQ